MHNQRETLTGPPDQAEPLQIGVDRLVALTPLLPPVNRSLSALKRMQRPRTKTQC